MGLAFPDCLTIYINIIQVVRPGFVVQKYYL